MDYCNPTGSCNFFVMQPSSFHMNFSSLGGVPQGAHFAHHNQAQQGLQQGFMQGFNGNAQHQQFGGFNPLYLMAQQLNQLQPPVQNQQLPQASQQMQFSQVHNQMFPGMPIPSMGMNSLHMQAQQQQNYQALQQLRQQQQEMQQRQHFQQMMNQAAAHQMHQQVQAPAQQSFMYPPSNPEISQMQAQEEEQRNRLRAFDQRHQFLAANQQNVLQLPTLFPSGQPAPTLPQLQLPPQPQAMPEPKPDGMPTLVPYQNGMPHLRPIAVQTPSSCVSRGGDAVLLTPQSNGPQVVPGSINHSRRESGCFGPDDMKPTQQELLQNRFHQDLLQMQRNHQQNHQPIEQPQPSAPPARQVVVKTEPEDEDDCVIINVVSSKKHRQADQVKKEVVEQPEAQPLLHTQPVAQDMAPVAPQHPPIASVEANNQHEETASISPAPQVTTTSELPPPVRTVLLNQMPVEPPGQVLYLLVPPSTTANGNLQQGETDGECVIHQIVRLVEPAPPAVKRKVQQEDEQVDPVVSQDKQVKKEQKEAQDEQTPADQPNPTEADLPVDKAVKKEKIEPENSTEQIISPDDKPATYKMEETVLQQQPEVKQVPQIEAEVKAAPTYNAPEFQDLLGDMDFVAPPPKPVEATEDDADSGVYDHDDLHEMETEEPRKEEIVSPKDIIYRPLRVMRRTTPNFQILEEKGISKKQWRTYCLQCLSFRMVNKHNKASDCMTRKGPHARWTQGEFKKAVELWNEERMEIEERREARQQQKEDALKDLQKQLGLHEEEEEPLPGRAHDLDEEIEDDNRRKKKGFETPVKKTSAQKSPRKEATSSSSRKRTFKSKMVTESRAYQDYARNLEWEDDKNAKSKKIRRSL